MDGLMDAGAESSIPLWEVSQNDNKKLFHYFWKVYMTTTSDGEEAD